MGTFAVRRTFPFGVCSPKRRLILIPNKKQTIFAVYFLSEISINGNCTKLKNRILIIELPYRMCYTIEV